MKVAFDSRPVSDLEGVGHYCRCLLEALSETAAPGDELVHARRSSALARSSAADVFHSPWVEGAMLHSPCPMVVTIHDLDALQRRSEHLRCGGLHLRMRRLALVRAAHVIVPDEQVAGEAVVELGLERERVVVIPGGSDASARPGWSWHDAARATWGVYARARATARTVSRLPGARLSTPGSVLRPQ
jgi:Glycosyltransferase Family 4